MGTVVVIGANRGIGLGFTQQYLEAGYEVVATYRDESKLANETTLTEDYKESLAHLQQVYAEKLKLYPLEITDEEAVEKFAKTIAKVDLLILNAGIKGYPVSGMKPEEHTSKHLKDAFEVNMLAPDNIVRYLYPLLLETADARVVYMSSKVAQTADNKGGGYHPYRGTKAGFDALVWNWSIRLMEKWKERNPQNLTRTPSAFAICPGWVRTDMGGPDARLSITESVSAMRKVIDHVGQTKKSNALYMHDGTIAEQYPTSEALEEILSAKEREETLSIK
jgi:NAD(P)-dependent dehydrogenase (short-subunit alcohol dehydrogenase family)